MAAGLPSLERSDGGVHDPTEQGQQGEEGQGRFSSKRETEAVLRLFRGEDLDSLSREYAVTASRLRSGAFGVISICC